MSKKTTRLLFGKALEIPGDVMNWFRSRSECSYLEMGQSILILYFDYLCVTFLELSRTKGTGVNLWVNPY